MFCSSLRNRPVWKVLSPILTSASEMKLQECYLDTHDFAFEIPNSRDRRAFRVILLTPSSLESVNRQDTISRLQQLSLTGDEDTAIAFILSEAVFTSASGRCNLSGMLDLQRLLLENLSTLIPIIPIPNSSAFLSSIQEYINAFTNHLQLPVSPAPPTALLAHMTASAPYRLLSEQDANVLSDLFPSLREISRAVRTEEGCDVLREYFEPETVRRVLEFWEGSSGLK